MTFLFIGGKSDARQLEARADANLVVRDDETYLKIFSKGDGSFFMRCGMNPIDALERFRELTRQGGS